MTGVSIIICCCNSARRLAETIQHIALQQVSTSIPWEVIIVDNASTDDTAVIAALEWAKYKLITPPFRVVTEPAAGLSYARKKGAAEAVFNYLIFCDDDNWLCKSYVETAFNLMEQWPDTGIIGGIGTARLEGAEPFWFGQYSSCYAVGQQNGNDGTLSGVSPYVYGAGSVIRKSIFNKIEEKELHLLANDRVNEKLSSGGDVELCFLAKLLGYEIAYSSRLEFYHYIEEKRLTEIYIKSLMHGFGYCNVVHRPYYWLFSPSLPRLKKSWIWVFAISMNIFLLTIGGRLKKRGKEEKFISNLNLAHARGRLDAILKLNNSIEKQYAMLKQKFSY